MSTPGATPRAIIVGGGIGGVTAAHALRRIGIDARVFERAPTLEAIQIGAGLYLWSNSLQALDHIGLAEPVYAIGAPVEKGQFLTWQGKLLGSWAVGDIGRMLGGATLGVSRPELHRVLAEPLDDEVLTLGAVCTGFTQDNDGVTAHFADGREERGTILVGADGLMSVVRRQLLGDSSPRHAGYVGCRAICHYDDEAAPHGVMRVFWGRGARMVHYRVTGGRMYWLALARGHAEGGHRAGGRKAPLLHRYAGWTPPIEAVIEATDEAAIHESDIVDRDPVSRWGEGRVTLLGDAAHPMTPNQAQGACQAIEDAVALGNAVKRDRDPVAALRDYEARRRKRATTFVKTSRRVGRMGLWESRIACALRDQVILRTLFVGQGGPKLRKDLTPVL
jgi:2-polyprenyl-6-methoxyphenol hydroxylase-like FAD-dependent oxidoreductase